MKVNNFKANKFSRAILSLASFSPTHVKMQFGFCEKMNVKVKVRLNSKCKITSDVNISFQLNFMKKRAVCNINFANLLNVIPIEMLFGTHTIY